MDKTKNKNKFIKVRVNDEEVEQFMKIAKDCGVTKTDLMVGVFKTLGKELVKVNNSEKRNQTKEALKEKCQKIKEEKGYLSISDLLKSISSTFKAGCDDIADDMNIAIKKKAIELQAEEVKKDCDIKDTNKVKI